VPVHLGRGAQLRSIPGSPPELHDIPAGCVYQSRCPLVQDICRAERPALRPVTSQINTPVNDAAGGPPANALSGGSPRPTRTAACHFSEEINNA